MTNHYVDVCFHFFWINTEEWELKSNDKCVFSFIRNWNYFYIATIPFELRVLWGNQSALKYFAKLNFLCSDWPWGVRCRKVTGKRHLPNQYFILCSKYQWMVAIKASVLLSVRKYTSFKTFHLTFEVKVSIAHSFPSFILNFGVPVFSKFTWREYFSWLTRTSHAYLLFHQKILNIEWTLFFNLEHSGCQVMWNGQKNQPEAFQFALLTQAG